jgi:rhodanese-related sulfurtransferase
MSTQRSGISRRGPESAGIALPNRLTGEENVNAPAFLRPLTCSLLLAAALPVVTFAAEPASAASELKAPVLTRAQVDALLATPEKIVIIDFRRPDEQAAKGVFPVYLSIQPENLAKSLAWIPRDRQILTVSNHKGRSGEAANLLVSKGFKVAGIVGAEFYKEQGGTLAKIEPPAPKKP